MKWVSIKTKDGFAIKEEGLTEKGFSDRIAEVNEYPKEREANARLIAAAPELLKMVQDLKLVLAGYMADSETAMSTDYALLDKADKLINKISK